MERNRVYINQLLSLSKASFDEPFRIEWTYLYKTEKQVAYLENRYALKNTTFNEKDVLAVGPAFQETLNNLLPVISSYPYTWPLDGQKLDPLGYDFSFDTSLNSIEIEPVAKEEMWRKLQIEAPAPALSTPYTRPEMVSGKHLTKFSLNLQKASPISLLSFQMQSALPVRLASLVYESDISGYSEPQKVNLDLLQIEQSKEVITILFGQPIFAKRLTFVLAQDNAKSNRYYRSATGEDFTYVADERDLSTLEKLIGKDGQTTVYQTDTVYTDNEIKDWSQERKQAYQDWRRLKLASLEEV